MTPRTREAWEGYYSDPKRFAQLFRDYETLKGNRENLSAEDTMKLEVIEQLIDKKLA